MAEADKTYVDVENAPTLQEFLAQRTGRASRPSIAQTYENWVAKPATAAVAGALRAPAAMLGAQSLQPPPSAQDSSGSVFDTAGDMASRLPDQIARLVVPQTLASAGIMAGTMGAGGLASNAGLMGFKAAGSRILGGTLGGMVGGGLEDPSMSGIARGGAEGLIGTAVGEAIGGTVNYAKQLGIDRMRQKMQTIDASAVGQAIEQIPKLGGVFAGYRTPEDLRSLALGSVELPSGKIANRGYALLAAEQQKVDDQIGAIIAQRPPIPSFGAQASGAMPSPTYIGKSAGFFPDPQDPSRFVPWTDMRTSLAELGHKAFGGIKGNPLEPTINGVDTKQMFAQAQRTIRQYLSDYDPSGQALSIFNKGQDQFEAGRYILTTLRAAFKGKEPNAIAFNSDKLQNRLGDRETEAAKKLGRDGLDLLANALNHGTGTGLGYQDLYAPSGPLSKVSEIMPLPGPAYARMKLGAPSLIGHPFNIPPMTRAGMSAVVGGGLSNVSRDLLPSP